MVPTLWPDLISATAIFIAIVDLPDPPFSLPTTIMCAERDGIVFSMDMSTLDSGWDIGLPQVYLDEIICRDSQILRQSELSACCTFFAWSSIGTFWTRVVSCWQILLQKSAAPSKCAIL